MRVWCRSGKKTQKQRNLVHMCASRNRKKASPNLEHFARKNFVNSLHQKASFMTTTAMKKQIHEALKSVENSEISLPLSIEEFYARNAQSQRDIKERKLIAQNTVKEKYGL